MKRAAADAGIEDVSTLLDEVMANEEKGSTFFNEGSAFPHLRIEGISAPVVCLGLTHRGVADVSTDNPIECVYLVLSPAGSPEVQLQVLALVSRAARSRYLFWNLKSAGTAEEALEDIRDWEVFQESGRAAEIR